MNIKKVVLFNCCILISQFSIAINWEKVPTVSIGAEVGFKSIAVIEKEANNDQIAKLSKGLSVAPSIIIASNEKYIWVDENWGYHVQVKGGWYSLNKQSINDDSNDLNTKISGFSIYAVPVGYYHFNKNVTDNWTYKLGVGVGLGWINLDGEFEVTNKKHLEYGEINSIDTARFGTALGVFFEANYKNHAVILQNYAPQISDDDYFYQQHNVAIAYRYKIEKKWFKDLIDK